MTGAAEPLFSNPFAEPEPRPSPIPASYDLNDPFDSTRATGHLEKTGPCGRRQTPAAPIRQNRIDSM